MEKRIDAGEKVISAIEKRHSPRAIIGPVPPKKSLLSILEAARWAPSAFNEQPWVFLVATADQPDDFQRALSCLVPGNQKWAQSAPVILFGVMKTTFDRDGSTNPTALFDLGLAVENLLLEAVNQGLVAHPMSGFSADSVCQSYGVPDGYAPKIAIALGYPGDPNSLEEPLLSMEKAERARKKIAEFAFTQAWGKSF